MFKFKSKVAPLDSHHVPAPRNWYSRYCCNSIFHKNAYTPHVDLKDMTYQQKNQEFLKHELHGILIVVDDSFSVIKKIRHLSIMKTYENYISDSCFDKNIETNDWKNKGLAWDIVGTYAIVYAGDGDIALHVMKSLSAETSTVLLSDQQMQRTNGDALIREAMLLHTRPTAIAIHSAIEGGKNNPEFLQFFQQYPEVGFITKPNQKEVADFLQLNFFSKIIMPSEISSDNTGQTLSPNISH
ncbi:MAG: hypothetical protein V4496_02670 [Pseudomonadota bacterium]